MNQFNAALLSAGVISMPKINGQPVSDNITGGKNNFAEIMSALINNANKNNMRETAAMMASNKNVRNAVYEAVTMINVMGSPKNSAPMSPEQLLNNPLVSNSIQSNNLSREEAACALKAIKAALAELVVAESAGATRSSAASAQETVSGKAAAKKSGNNSAAGRGINTSESGVKNKGSIKAGETNTPFPVKTDSNNSTAQPRAAAAEGKETVLRTAYPGSGKGIEEPVTKTGENITNKGAVNNTNGKNNTLINNYNNTESGNNTAKAAEPAAAFSPGNGEKEPAAPAKNITPAASGGMKDSGGGFIPVKGGLDSAAVINSGVNRSPAGKGAETTNNTLQAGNNTGSVSYSGNSGKSGGIQIADNIEAGAAKQAMPMEGKAAETSKAIDILIKGLEDIINRYINFHSMLAGENKTSSGEAKNINENISRVSESLSLLNTPSAAAQKEKAGEVFAGIINKLADISRAAADMSPDAEIAPAAQPALSRQGQQFVKELIDYIKQVRPEADINYNSGSKNLYSASKEFSLAVKEAVGKIFLFLNELNGEMKVFKKIDYVYKPNSNKTSQVTPEGNLLVNTAKLNMSPSLIKNGTDPAYAAKLIQDTLNGQQIKTGPAETPGNTRAGVQAAGVQNGLNVNDYTVGARSGAKENYLNNESIKNPVQPPAFQQNTRGNFLPNAADSRSRAENRFVKNMEYVAAGLNNKIGGENIKLDAQEPVNAGIFRKVAETAGRIKEDIVIKQVVDNIENAVEVNRKTGVKITLRPENLGSVIIKIETSHDKTIKGTIQVTGAEVKDILKANIPELRAALSALGFEADELDVSLMNRDTENNYGDSGRDFSGDEETAVPVKNIEEILGASDIYDGSHGYLSFLA